MSVLTPEFRGSFVTLIEPRESAPNARPQYSMMVVLDKSDAQTAPFMKELKEAMEEVWYERHKTKLPREVWDFNIKNGDGPITNTGKTYDELTGCWVFRTTAGEDRQPRVIDTHKRIVTDPKLLRSGNWFRASVSPWAWKAFSGVSIDLNSVLFVREDDPYAGGNEEDAEEVFDEFFEDEDEDEDDLFA